MTNKTKKIFDQIDNSRDEIIHLQSELTSKVALGPENGGTGEHDKTEFIYNLLNNLHPDFIKVYEAPDSRAKGGTRPNLVVRWNGTDNTSTVWVLCHADVVPPGDLSLWKADPYRVTVEGDRITGRGVEDNQHGFVSFYLAIKYILENRNRLSRSTGLVLVADEETGSKYGLDFLLNHHGDLFCKNDIIIVPDGGNEDGTMIEIAEKSMLWLKFTVTGQQCHASTPEKGRNTLLAMAQLTVTLYEALKKKFACHDDIFSPPLSTFEPTKVESNVQNVNTIPGKDVFYMDCRILPSYTTEEVLRFIKDVCRKTGNMSGIMIDVKPVQRLDAPNPTPVDSPVVKILSRAIKAVTGRDAKPMGIGGGTIAAFFRQANLPAAVWSTVSDSAHQPDEFCLISNIMSDAKVFAYIFTTG